MSYSYFSLRPYYLFPTHTFLCLWDPVIIILPLPFFVLGPCYHCPTSTFVFETSSSLSCLGFLSCHLSWDPTIFCPTPTFLRLLDPAIFCPKPFSSLSLRLPSSWARLRHFWSRYRLLDHVPPVVWRASPMQMKGAAQ